METLWHPSAKRVPISTAPQALLFEGGQGRYCTWHTTEPGEHPRPIKPTDIDGAVQAYRDNGDCPTFTIMVVNGKRTLYQHLPLNRAASALKHPRGTRPTNTLGKVHTQVEIVQFAAVSKEWSDATYHYLNLLAKWLEKHADIPLTTHVAWRHPVKLNPNAAVHSGHLGHMHWWSNDHVDPGAGFHIGKVIKA